MLRTQCFAFIVILGNALPLPVIQSCHLHLRVVLWERLIGRRWVMALTKRMLMMHSRFPHLRQIFLSSRRNRVVLDISNRLDQLDCYLTVKFVTLIPHFIKTLQVGR